MQLAVHTLQMNWICRLGRYLMGPRGLVGARVAVGCKGSIRVCGLYSGMRGVIECNGYSPVQRL